MHAVSPSQFFRPGPSSARRGPSAPGGRLGLGRASWILRALGLAAGLLAAGAAEGALAEWRTLQLHRANPRYLEWRAQPLLVIGSGEHYGAVLNGDFDFVKYLATLRRDGLNHTRLFTGAAYVEPQGAFNIARNTLAPEGSRYLAPWARSDQPGYAGGGQRFDLDRWDEAYFERLRRFVGEARRRKVIVEVNLFCPFYEEAQWRLSPFHPGNNVNGAGTDVARTNVYTLDRNGGLLAYQERFVRRVVEDLREFDNFYYEICNEPYFGGVTLEWQARIAAVIAQAQASHRNPKLISQNIANNQAKVGQPLPHVSIFNFHYASPPDTVALNAHLGLPIGDNETGFRGTNDAPYRMEAWDFMVAGGALFSHLDYSFAVGHEDGSFTYPASQPGGGNPTLRRQFRILREFLGRLPFTRMHPDPTFIAGGVPPSHTARALVEPGRAAAVYLRPRVVSRFSVRWTGWLDVPETGDYAFHASSNDGLRVWIEDDLVIDRWVEQTEAEFTVTRPVDRGRHRIKVEYFYNGGQAAAKLAWSRPGHPKQPIPVSAFRLPDDTGAGLRGEYFLGRDFDRPWHVRTDPGVDFAWGLRPPFEPPASGAPATLQFNVPPGQWAIQWMDPRNGRALHSEIRRHRGSGPLAVVAPPFEEDVAVKLTRQALQLTR